MQSLQEYGDAVNLARVTQMEAVELVLVALGLSDHRLMLAEENAALRPSLSLDGELDLARLSLRFFIRQDRQYVEAGLMGLELAALIAALAHIVLDSGSRHREAWCLRSPLHVFRRLEILTPFAAVPLSALLGRVDHRLILIAEGDCHEWYGTGLRSENVKVDRQPVNVEVYSWHRVQKDFLVVLVFERRMIDEIRHHHLISQILVRLFDGDAERARHVRKYANVVQADFLVPTHLRCDAHRRVE